MALRSLLITSACAVALLAGCAPGSVSGSARLASPGKVQVTATDNQIPAASPRDMDGFFAMNAITPYHHWVAGGEVRTNAVSVMEQNLDAAQEAGATSVRVDAWWHVIEPQQ